MHEEAPNYGIYYDWPSAKTDENWRRHVGWPIGAEETNKLLCQQLAATLEFINSLDDIDDRNALNLAAHGFLVQGRRLFLAPLLSQRLNAMGLSWKTSDPVFNYILGNTNQWPNMEFSYEKAPPIAMPGIRKVARSATWNSPFSLMRSLVSPKATAITHNYLLREAAADLGAVSYEYAHIWVEEALEKGSLQGMDIEGLARALVDHASIGLFGDGSETQDRARKLSIVLAQSHIKEAAKALNGLKKRRSLPDLVWSGSGGKFQSRAVGLEVMRRGGCITRFDHGGTTGLVSNEEALALTELSVSSKFVVMTEGIAKIPELEKARKLAGSIAGQIVAARGDQQFRAVPRKASRTPGRSRPVVIYAPTLLLGERMLSPSLTPDVVYLDWQLRIASRLNALDIDLVCKPHPEGLLRGSSHPLSQIAKTHVGPFQEIRDTADVFVFDYPPTTTFWESICGDRKVVVLNLMMTEFTKTIKPHMDRRITQVTAEWDQWGRPQISDEVLEHAILDGWQTSYDGGFFRRILAGEEKQ